MKFGRVTFDQGNRGPAKSQISWGSDIPEIPLDLGISLEREELVEDSAE